MNEDGMPAEHFQLPLLSLELHACLLDVYSNFRFHGFLKFSSDESKILRDVQYYGTNFFVDKVFPVGFYCNCEYVKTELW